MAAALVAALLAVAPAGAASSSLPPASVVFHGPTNLPRIALTFDDNFRPGYALPVLQVLRQYDVKATMFVTKVYTTAHLDLDQAMALGGFEIGDHSATHPDYTTLSRESLLYEIGAGTSAYQDMTGSRTVPLFRPPYGRSDATVTAVAAEKGFQYEVEWDVDPSDWMGLAADVIAQNVLSHAHNGAIVLLHLAAPHTFEALPAIITGLRQRGFELVTVSELLKGNRQFIDVTSSTSGADAISRLVFAGYMSGYDDSWFGPYDTMKRAQFAKTAVLAAHKHTPEIEAAENPTFTDVSLLYGPSGDPLPYPFDFVEEAAAAGLIQGYDDGNGGRRFDPYADITRLQLARMVARMARTLKGYPEVLAAAGQNVEDFEDVPDEAKADVALVSSLGLMDGYLDGQFGSWQAARRCHVALVINRFLALPDYVPPGPGPTTTTTSTTISTTTTTEPLPTTSTSGTVPPSTTSTATTTTTTLISPPTTTTGTTAPM